MMVDRVLHGHERKRGRVRKLRGIRAGFGVNVRVSQRWKLVWGVTLDGK